MDQRQLTDLERDILNKLLSLPFPGSSILKEQIENCEAKPTEDPDNYGSIYLLTKSSKKADTQRRVPVEGLADDADGGQIDIILHVEDGFVSELEIVKLDGSPIKGAIDPTKIEVVLNEG
jgi:hypothetical protein